MSSIIVLSISLSHLLFLQSSIKSNNYIQQSKDALKKAQLDDLWPKGLCIWQLFVHWNLIVSLSIYNLWKYMLVINFHCFSTIQKCVILLVVYQHFCVRNQYKVLNLWILLPTAIVENTFMLSTIAKRPLTFYIFIFINFSL